MRDRLWSAQSHLGPPTAGSVRLDAGTAWERLSPGRSRDPDSSSVYPAMTRDAYRDEVGAVVRPGSLDLEAWDLERDAQASDDPADYLDRRRCAQRALVLPAHVEGLRGDPRRVRVCVRSLRIETVTASSCEDPILSRHGHDADASTHPSTDELDLRSRHAPPCVFGRGCVGRGLRPASRHG